MWDENVVIFRWGILYQNFLMVPPPPSSLAIIILVVSFHLKSFFQMQQVRNLYIHWLPGDCFPLIFSSEDIEASYRMPFVPIESNFVYFVWWAKTHSYPAHVIDWDAIWTIHLHVRRHKKRKKEWKKNWLKMYTRDVLSFHSESAMRSGLLIRGDLLNFHSKYEWFTHSAC